MAFNNLPPQAYTRDVLMAAYDWLQSQPASIRELAVGPDALVSLFMQARRRVNAGATGTVQNGNGAHNQSVAQQQAQPPAGATGTPFPISVQAPMTTASAEAFKQDLKSLAADLKQFEDSKTAVPTPVAATNYIAPMPYTPPPAAPTFTAPAPSTPPPVAYTPAPTVKPDPENAVSHLDARTRQVLSEVKQKLNVSSESEAMRLLIAIGYEKIRDILPKN
jgi:hypothetical protein